MAIMSASGRKVRSVISPEVLISEGEFLTSSLLSGSLQSFYQVILLFLFRFSLLIIVHVKVVICIRHFAVIITSGERVLLVIWFS
jgi:hypothetical protein